MDMFDEQPAAAAAAPAGMSIIDYNMFVSVAHFSLCCPRSCLNSYLKLFQKKQHQFKLYPINTGGDVDPMAFMAAAPAAAAPAEEDPFAGMAPAAPVTQTVYYTFVFRKIVFPTVGSSFIPRVTYNNSVQQY